MTHDLWEYLQVAYPALALLIFGLLSFLAIGFREQEKELRPIMVGAVVNCLFGLTGLLVLDPENRHSESLLQTITDLCLLRVVILVCFEIFYGIGHDTKNPESPLHQVVFQILCGVFLASLVARLQWLMPKGTPTTSTISHGLALVGTAVFVCYLVFMVYNLATSKRRCRAHAGSQHKAKV